MASISPISATGPLPHVPSASQLPSPPMAPPAPSPLGAAATDTAAFKSGQSHLEIAAQTSLWSNDFAFPTSPSIPPIETAAWSWDEMPAVAMNTGGMAPSTLSDPVLLELLMETMRSHFSDGADVSAVASEPDFDFLDWVTQPVRVIADGVAVGTAAVLSTLQDVGQSTGHAVQQIAAEVGHAVQGAAGALGEAASNTWKSIASFRLW